MGCWGITAFESDAGLDAVCFIRAQLPEDGHLKLAEVLQSIQQDDWNAPAETGSLLFRFQDLWGIKKVNNPHFRDGISPHLWISGGKPEWYVYQPSEADRQQLRTAVQIYLDAFREPMQAHKCPAVKTRQVKSRLF